MNPSDSNTSRTMDLPLIYIIFKLYLTCQWRRSGAILLIQQVPGTRRAALAKNPQWSITLDRYHRFVVEQLEDVFGTSRSDVIGSMVRSWVSDHPDQIRQAGASIEEWRKQRDRGSD